MLSEYYHVWPAWGFAKPTQTVSTWNCMFRIPCLCFLQTPILEGFQENRNGFSFFMLRNLLFSSDVEIAPNTHFHRCASRTVLRNKPGFLHLSVKIFIVESLSMCFLFMFFEQNDPVSTISCFFLKYCDQQVNPSHSEKDHYLFINYELFIIHYLLLNLQKQAEGHTTIGFWACDLFTKAGKKKKKK